MSVGLGYEKATFTEYFCLVYISIPFIIKLAIIESTELLIRIKPAVRVTTRIERSGRIFEDDGVSLRHRNSKLFPGFLRKYDVYLTEFSYKRKIHFTDTFSVEDLKLNLNIIPNTKRQFDLETFS